MVLISRLELLESSGHNNFQGGDDGPGFRITGGDDGRMYKIPRGLIYQVHKYQLLREGQLL
jgi:hypothetical protein